MLGLKEEQVVEISGDHSKYEVLDFLKKKLATSTSNSILDVMYRDVLAS